jgi:hypothetical protein
VGSAEGGTVSWVVPIDDVEFQTLLEQVRELHQLADELTHSSARIHANVRARLNWSQEAPALPADQTKLADEVLEVLEEPRLSSFQSRQLKQAFFGK